MDVARCNRLRVVASGDGETGSYPRNPSKRVGSALLVAAMAAILLLCGCAAVGPDFVRPTATMNDEWVEAVGPRIKREPADLTDWWTVLNDPVLDSLVEMAYKENLPLRVAGVRILQARAQLGFAIGTQYPQLQQARFSAAGVQISDNAPNAAILDQNFGDYSLGLDAAWELDFWGKFRRGVESAYADYFASISSYNDFLVSLTGEVARVYVVIRTLEERIKLAQANVKIQERSLQIAEVRFRNGLVTELDVTQARTLLRTTQALIPNLETSLHQAKHGLSILLGMPPSDLQDILGDPRSIPTAPAEVAVGIPAELLRRRPDIRFAELQAAAQSARIGIAKADLYPQFVLFGSLGLQASSHTDFLSNNSSFSDLFSGDSFTYFFGASIKWPILNYGRIKNRVRIQDAAFQQLMISYQNTVLQAAREVEDSMVAFLKSQDEASFLSDGVAAAERSVELALIQYRDGLVDYQRVLDTQRSLTEQQDGLTATRGSITLNLVAMYKALGGGWQSRVGDEFIPEYTKDEMRNRVDWGRYLEPEQKPPSPFMINQPWQGIEQASYGD